MMKERLVLLSVLSVQLICSVIATNNTDIEPRQGGSNDDEGPDLLNYNPAEFENDQEVFTEVPNEVGRIVLVDPLDITRYELHCRGDVEMEDRIYWLRNGARLDHSDRNIEYGKVMIIYRLNNYDEAYYYCNGIGIWVTRKFVPKESSAESFWKNSKLRCIDEIEEEVRDSIVKKEVEYGGVERTTEVEVRKRSFPQAIHPIKEFIVEGDVTRKCNGTDEFNVLSETVPTTTVEFKNKEVICTSSDKQGRCDLTIWFGNKNITTGRSPIIKHKYGKINIQAVRCSANCFIGRDIVALEVQSIEINRTLYICVIFVIILIILIIILIICCVLWHKFGFKEKYGYQIQMRLKRNFAVDGNKLSSYRLSGVEADGAVEDEDSEEPDVKEFRDMDEGSLEDESFVDPNFARTHKPEMRSKDDISGHSHPSQRPFLRI